MKGISKNEFLLSLLISLSYFIFWMLAIFISSSGSFNFLLKTIVPFTWRILFITLVNLFVHLIALPFVRTRKTKWSWMLVTFVLVLLLITLGFKSWVKLGNFLAVLHSPVNRGFSMYTEVVNVLPQLFGLGYFASIQFFIDYYKLKSKNQQLAVEKKTAELSYLKSQTNPHFLFNTLNNIYTLCRDKSDLAPESLLRLSGILRYMLYETQAHWVPVDKEIQIIRDYIELEKLRYDSSLKINFMTNTNNTNLEIPPLLIIPLVENAFKHGVSETMGEPFIHVRLSIELFHLRFEVENSMPGDNAADAVIESIGISNVRRQLQLLFTDYELIIEKRSTTFFAGMYINLNSYAKN